MYLTLVPIVKRYTFHTADGTEYARVPHATGALEPWTHRGSFTSLFNIGAAQVRIHLFCACAARCKVERLRGAMLEALTLTPESYAPQSHMLARLSHNISAVLNLSQILTLSFTICPLCDVGRNLYTVRARCDARAASTSRQRLCERVDDIQIRSLP